ncbi:MAG: hypothetical protein HFE80_01015 [Clostridiaceae bacterium]|nr:hypothetical protein [Clostridiaceae bacterium]
MKKSNMAQAAAAATLLLAAMALTSLYLSHRQTSQAGIVALPQEQSGPGSQPAEQGPLADGVTVDTSNVLRIIRTLNRPQEYTFEAESTLSYYSASDTLRVRGAVKGRRSKLQMVSAAGAVEKEIIVAPSGYYAWQAGRASLYSGALGGDWPEDGDLAAFCDEASRIPTYEDVLTLGEQDPDCLLDAGYAQRDGQACIYVLVENKLAGAQDSYYISIDTGLLYEARSEKKGRTIYQMKQTAFQQEAVEESQFTLPNGQQIAEE